MRFIIDAHLPFALVRVFQEGGHDAIHTKQLPLKNSTSDIEIIRLSIEENRVVITKDQDFFDSFILHRKPPKLVLVKTGNLLFSDTIALFQTHLDLLVDSLKENNLVELGREGISIIL